MSGEIDIVLPVCARDCDRLQILGASLRRFWHVPGVLRVFADDGDHEVVLDAARKHLVGRDLHVEVRRMSDLLERAPSKGTRKGWWRQQLVKLVAARVVESDFYLTIDADFFAVRPVEFEDLVRRGRGVVSYEARDRFDPAWYQASRTVLGLDIKMPTRFVSLAPFLMARSPVKNLLAWLQQKYGPQWAGALLTSVDYRPWTEYTLYYLHALYAGLWDAFHVEAPPLVGNSVWMLADIESWDPRKSFEPEPSFFFSLVQSHTTLPASWVWERVAPFLAAAEGEVRAGADGGGAE